MTLKNVLSKLAQPWIGLASVLATVAQLYAGVPFGQLLWMFATSTFSAVWCYSLIPGTHDNKETFTFE